VKTIVCVVRVYPTNIALLTLHSRTFDNIFVSSNLTEKIHKIKRTD